MSDEPSIPPSGAVFTFGKSKFAENAPGKFWIRGDSVVDVKCGDEHTAVATRSGRLFTFGRNEWGQLGHGHSNQVPRPTCVKSLKPLGVRLVACGKAHTLVVTNSGKVMAFGSNADGQLGVGRTPEFSETPLEITSWPANPSPSSLTQLAAGSAHSMALCGHRVVVWGSNTEGQLGLGEDAEETVPTPVVMPFHSRVSLVACGYYHSALVTDEGHLYTFGDAEGGKLGLGHREDHDACDSPTRVSIDEKIVDVSCGGTHTLALSASGRVYSFGHSTNGELGLGTRVVHTDVPVLLSSLSAHHVVAVSCGQSHSAVVSEAGVLFTFGDGRHGKLCLEAQANAYSPVPVVRLKSLHVITAVCGGTHTMVLARDRSPTNPAVDESIFAVITNGSDQVNEEARRRHRDSIKGSRQLPPIRRSLQQRQNTASTPDDQPSTSDATKETQMEVGQSAAPLISDSPETVGEDANVKNGNPDAAKPGSKISSFFKGFKKKQGNIQYEQEAKENGHGDDETITATTTAENFDAIEGEMIKTDSDLGKASRHGKRVTFMKDDESVSAASEEKKSSVEINVTKEDQGASDNTASENVESTLPKERHRTRGEREIHSKSCMLL